MIGLRSAQTHSGQGRGGEAPIILLAGRRISGFAEVRDLPTKPLPKADLAFTATYVSSRIHNPIAVLPVVTLQQVSLFHTVHLTDRLTLRRGLAPIDLLGGDAVSLRGGQPSHGLELSGNAVYHGRRMRFGGTRQSATTVTTPDGVAAKGIALWTRSHA